MFDEIANQPDAKADHGPALQYLTFTLGDEVFAMDIRCVREIIQHGSMTMVPLMPDFVRGVINLRGSVVPVIDLRVKFGMGTPKYDRFTVVIMVMVGARVVGAVVDGVSDVMDVSAADWVPAPEMGADIDTSFLTGIAKQGDRLISLLEIERVVGMGAELEAALAA